LSIGVLPTVARRMCDLENLVNEEVIARVGLQHQENNNINIIMIVGDLLVRHVSACICHVQVILVRNGGFGFRTLCTNVNDLACVMDCVVCLVSIFLGSCL
jgi:hypothetical protein